MVKTILVGGFNSFEQYWSNWIISPGRGESKKYLKPPPSIVLRKTFSKQQAFFENDHRRRRNVIHWSSMKLNGCRLFWGEPLCFDGVWHPSCTVTYMFISWKYHQHLTRRQPSTIWRPTCHRMFVALLASSSQQQVTVQWFKFRYLHAGKCSGKRFCSRRALT